jgi:hypothetical protein
MAKSKKSVGKSALHQLSKRSKAKKVVRKNKGKKIDFKPGLDTKCPDFISQVVLDKHGKKRVGLLVAGRVDKFVLISGSKCNFSAGDKFDNVKAHSIAEGKLTGFVRKNILADLNSDTVAEAIQDVERNTIPASLGNALPDFASRAGRYFKGCVVLHPLVESYLSGTK